MLEYRSSQLGSLLDAINNERLDEQQRAVPTSLAKTPPLTQFAAHAVDAITTCEAKCKSRVEQGSHWPLWIVVYDDCVAHCRALNGISDVSKKMRELQERNFETGWEGEYRRWWFCQRTCAEQSSNIIKFRQCMELCHEDPKTKDLAEKYMKELDE